MYDDGKCTKLSPIKRFFFQKLYSRVCMMLGLCASLRCNCVTSNWQKEPCSRICREMRPPPSTSRLSYISSSSLLFPSISSSFSLFSFFSSSSSSFFSPSSPFLHYIPPFPPPSGSLESFQALPPRMQGPVGQALECLHTGLVSSSPRFENNNRFMIIYSLQDIYRFHRYP